MKFTAAFLIFALAAKTFATVPVKRASLDAAGVERPGRSMEPAISGDGRFVVFSSVARLTGGDTNGRPDVFVKDLATGAIERISDARGGDQPSLSADGNFVVYRSLDEQPKIRKFDRRSGGPRDSVSFPFINGQSRRFGDAGFITPTARFVPYLFRPEPANTGQTGHQVNLHEMVPEVSLGDSQQTIAAALRDASRPCATNSGAFVAWASTEPFDADDTNNLRDVLLFDGASTRAVSALAGNIAAAGASFDPVFSADGTRLVFLSDAALLPADADGRTSIYFASSSNGFSTVNFIPTPLRPVALGPQAASAVGTIAYATINTANQTAVYLTDYAGTSKAVVPASAILGAPALSADGSTLAYSSGAILLAGDRNLSADIYVADVSSLFGNAPRAAPVPVFTTVTDGQVVTANANFTVSASASDAGGSIRELILELDGTIIATGAGVNLSKTINPAPGSHTLTIRAFNDAFVASENTVTILARPASGQRGITGATDSTAIREADGSLAWAGTIRIENRTALARDFRLSLVVAPAPATMGPNESPGNGAGFPNPALLPPREEQVAFVSAITSVGANGFALIDADAVIPFPEIIGNGLQGIAWSLIAILTEEQAGSATVAERQTIFTEAPVLAENTNGPNGGATRTGALLTDTALTPFAITQIQINTPPAIPELTTRRLTATARFSDNSTRPCSPKWSLASGAGIAVLTPGGLLTVFNVNTPATIRVRAELIGAPPAEQNISIIPVVPIVSVIASDAKAAEENNAGRFRIIRTTALNSPLTVNFTIGGTAVEGAAYASIPRSVSFASGQKNAFVDVLPVANAVFSGIKTVTLTLQADTAYRLGASRNALVRIADDEAPLPRQADLILRSGRTIVGTHIYEPPSPLTPLTQAVQRVIAPGGTAAFALDAMHRGTETGTYIFRGAPDFTGFIVRYFDGRTEITADVIGGGFQFTLAPAARKTFIMRVTATAAAPVGFRQRLPVELRESGADPNTAIPDAGEFVVLRVK